MQVVVLHAGVITDCMRKVRALVVDLHVPEQHKPL
jgi:hypothetical protein